MASIGLFYRFEIFLAWIVISLSGVHPAYPVLWDAQQAGDLNPLHQLEGSDHLQHQADQVPEDPEDDVPGPVHHRRHPVRELPCHDGLHPVLFLPVLCGGSAPEAGGDEARVRLPAETVSVTCQGPGHAPLLLPAQASQEGDRVPAPGGEAGQEHPS